MECYEKYFQIEMGAILRGIYDCNDVIYLIKNNFNQPNTQKPSDKNQDAIAKFAL